MKAEQLAQHMKESGIESIIGVPDSQLKEFCDYMNHEGGELFKHYVPANEGAAVGMGAGVYLGSGKPVCVYMQNSGIGNTINPIASLINNDVYDIPMLFLIGWRGEPGTKDEPQHVCQGKITCSLLDTMKIAYAIIDKETDEDTLQSIFETAKEHLQTNCQFAIIVRKGTFEKRQDQAFQNDYSFVREAAIATILKHSHKEDVIVSTTGKISRELYEQSDMILGNHEQSFLTVGSMGHASMIAYGISEQKKDRTIICVDGDGAALMHMGSIAFLGKQQPHNLIHIILNNDVHESVGGMPTGAVQQDYADVAKACHYAYTTIVKNEEELRIALQTAREQQQLSMIEIKVKIDSRDDLGRPKETPIQNKENFMNYHEVKR